MSEQEQNESVALVKAQGTSIELVSSGLIRRGMEDLASLARQEPVELNPVIIQKRALILCRDTIADEIIQTILTSIGIDSEICDDPEELYQFLSRRDYNLVIPTNFGIGSDYILELVKEMRESNSEVKILVISGWYSDEFKIELVDNHIDAFFRAPFRLLDLRNKINEILQDSKTTV